MIEILNINEKIISLSINNESLACYSNNKAGRSIVKDILNANNSYNLWDKYIIPIWGNEPKVETPKIEIDVEALRKNKQLEIKQLCHDKIVEGILIDLGLKDEEGNPLGELHYTLSEKNQADMRDLALMIEQGANIVTWRDDSRVSHMIYTAQQFMTLYNSATQYILKCRFHSDGLEELLFSYSDDQIDLISNINWDTELPDNIKDKMNDLLNVMLNDI